MKRRVTRYGTFGLPCGCHLLRTTRGHAWKQCDLHKAAPDMLKALDRVMFARRTGDGCGVLGWDLFYKCGNAVNKANQRWTDNNLRKGARWLTKEMADHKIALTRHRALKRRRSVNKVGAV
jgi:hypothetical protein